MTHPKIEINFSRARLNVWNFSLPLSLFALFYTFLPPRGKVARAYVFSSILKVLKADNLPRSFAVILGRAFFAFYRYTRM